MGEFSSNFVAESIEILQAIDTDVVDQVATGIAGVRERGGRLFILGVGGSAGHASHAVNDFRKLCGVEAYAPTDNVSELTARTNDEGWDTTFSAWLEVSRFGPDDALLIFSVGGGDAERNISPNLVRAVDLAQQVGASIFGIVGREGGHTAAVGTAVVVIPPLYGDRITPHTEGLAAVVWHLLVSHPELQRSATKWESAARPTASGAR
jgi:D-sedoheptulose 7-phosphate isomerase